MNLSLLLGLSMVLLVSGAQPEESPASETPTIAKETVVQVRESDKEDAGAHPGIVTRIVGGNEAGEMYPHMVSIRKGGKHLCGGAIISHQWILTAAHCTVDEKPGTITAVVGTNHLNHGGHTYHISKIIPHEEHNKEESLNDIALLHVSGSINFVSGVSPIPLAKKDPKTGSSAAFSGWGRTAYDHPTLPNALQQLATKVISLSKCKSAHSGYTIDNRQICTLVGKGKGVCKADSGGPLIAASELIGIASWGTYRCGNGKPDVFTSVAHFRPWIKKHAGL